MSNKKTRYFVAISGAILAVGLGTGLVASYMGLPVSVFSRAAGPEELQYIPADAAVVAYANVRDVMNSEFRQRFKALEPSQDQKNEFEEKTGVNLEQDVDSITAAIMPKDGMTQNPAGAFLIIAKGRYQPAKLEALALEHGAEFIDYQGKRIITHRETNASGDANHDDVAFGFVDAELVAFGSLSAVKASIDAHASNRNVVSNNERRDCRPKSRRSCRRSPGSRRPRMSTAASTVSSRPKPRMKRPRRTCATSWAGSWRWRACRPRTSRACSSWPIRWCCLAKATPSRSRSRFPAKCSTSSKASRRIARSSSCSTEIPLSGEGGTCVPPFLCTIRRVAEHVFFYGTLMAPFNRPGRQRISPKLVYKGRGTIRAALFDLGIYPAAVPTDDGSRVWGEIYETNDAQSVLSALDEIEGYRPNEPERSLYTRVLTDATLEDGGVERAWAYFYNAPLGQAQRIASGDYLEHLNAR
jgi:gamma-glutamylcyclotransferase (GGCT)/AIG2-like uncharacterized protein YtfP